MFKKIYILIIIIIGVSFHLNGINFFLGSPLRGTSKGGGIDYFLLHFSP